MMQVSIIMPYYNSAALYNRETVEAIIAHTWVSVKCITSI